MTFTISHDDPRSIKAIEIAAGAGQWLKCKTDDGRKAYGVPSSCKSKAGEYYIVDGQTCTCEDFKRNGLSPERRGQAGYHGPCKHILAVQLHCELVKAQRAPARRRRGHLELLPSPVQQLASRFDDIFRAFEGD